MNDKTLEKKFSGPLVVALVLAYIPGVGRSFTLFQESSS
jgi:hypothetical protein